MELNMETTCTKCTKKAVRQAKRTDGFTSLWGKEWREYCNGHLAEQVGKYPLSIKDLGNKAT